MIKQCQAEPYFDAKEFCGFVKAEEQITRTIASLSMKMRINQSALMREDRRKQPSLLRKPWDKAEG